MSNLPKLADLTTDIEKAYKDDQLNLLLNQEPKREWVREHPYIKDYIYIPIGIIEMLLRRIFKNHRIEITGQGSSFNGVWVTVRVHYFNPASNEWSFHDGIGAIQLQTKSGSTPADLANINNGALSMAYPHAKSLAVKDACDNFGKLFGSDLNRRDTLGYNADANLKPPKPNLEGDELHEVAEAVQNGDMSIERVRELYELDEIAEEMLCQK